jgi:hypothetical protein
MTTGATDSHRNFCIPVQLNSWLLAKFNEMITGQSYAKIKSLFCEKKKKYYAKT